MRRPDALHPVAMQRVALVAPTESLRDLLVQVADTGCVELDPQEVGGVPVGAPTPAADALQARPRGVGGAVLSRTAPDLDRCLRDGRLDVVAGEAQLERFAACAVHRDRVSALAGWAPAMEVPDLAERLAAVGGAVVPLARPAGAMPPTFLARGGAAKAFAPLVETYGTVPYRDVDPSVFAGLAYVVMFGMMFADVGHGALLLGVALAVRLGRPARAARLRPAVFFLLGAGLASIVFGAVYGEFFGPTHVVPVLWLAPLDHPVTLLGAALGVGAVLLACAYALGTANRLREGGWRLALYAPAGLAGSVLFLGVGAIGGGLYLDTTWLAVTGAVASAGALGLAFAGMFVEAGAGGGGAAQATVTALDLVIRLGSNLVSFTRLAAFGLTHAAIGAVVWDGTTALWHRGPFGALGGALVFVAGNLLAIALEGLVAAIQALRLEYYELFSRVFDREGRPFRPWRVPVAPGGAQR